MKLPRTRLAEDIACGLMQHLATDDAYSREGKMYGVLLAETASGEQQVLKAFSGLMNGNSVVEGWVPPIPGRNQVAFEEARTLAILEAVKQELIVLQHTPERKQYEALSQEFGSRLQQLAVHHRERKQERIRQRRMLLETVSGEALEVAQEQLDEQSRRDGIERRQLKQQRDAVLQPLKNLIEQADAQIHELKQRRKGLSRQLQAQMHANYWLTNLAGESLPLQQLMPGGFMPTGTGDCCAPKLLHYAATHGLKPLSMAEFWWGPPSTNGDKVQGEFYGACAERCQPLMGFLLSGLHQLSPLAEIEKGDRRQETEDRRKKKEVDSDPTQIGAASHIHQETQKYAPLLSPEAKCTRYEWFPSCRLVDFERSLPILWEDEYIIAVNKPSGLLSVPGRYRDRQDSVLSRLRHLLPEGMALTTVHRLDQDTSGILLLARDQQTYRHLSRQFQQRRVHKVYEALLAGATTSEHGVLNLPLWADPDDRPYQKVDWQRGKPSITRFQVIGVGDYTRIEFFPLTGRTHQLRVHAADPRGLGIPILGDRLYGCCPNKERLHLHAKRLCFEHPHSGKTISLQTQQTPF